MRAMEKVLILFFLFPRSHMASAAWQTLHWTQYKGSQVPLICIRIGRLEGKRNDFQGLVLERRKSHVCLVYIVSKVPELHSRGKIKQWQECTFVSHLYLSVLQETSNITCLFGWLQVISQCEFICHVFKAIAWFSSSFLVSFGVRVATGQIGKRKHLEQQN